MSRIIGLAGNVGAGKDTVADALARDGKFVKLAFADALKRELIEAFDCDPAFFNNRVMKEQATWLLTMADCARKEFVDWYVTTRNGEYELQVMGACFFSQARTPRWLMQTWGDFRKANDPGYWIRKLADKIAMHTPHHCFVISDVRFEDEAAFVRGADRGNMVCEVLRPNNPHSSKTQAHSSNNRLTLIDRIILNSGTVNQLERKAERLGKIFLKIT